MAILLLGSGVENPCVVQSSVKAKTKGSPASLESAEAQSVDTEGQLYDSGIMPKALDYSLLSGIQMLFWLWLFAYVTLTIPSQLPSSPSAPPPWLSCVCDSGIWYKERIVLPLLFLPTLSVTALWQTQGISILDEFSWYCNFCPKCSMRSIKIFLH